MAGLRAVADLSVGLEGAVDSAISRHLPTTETLHVGLEKLRHGREREESVRIPDEVVSLGFLSGGKLGLVIHETTAEHTIQDFGWKTADVVFVIFNRDVEHVAIVLVLW